MLEWIKELRRVKLVSGMAKARLGQAFYRKAFHFTVIMMIIVFFSSSNHESMSIEDILLWRNRQARHIQSFVQNIKNGLWMDSLMDHLIPFISLSTQNSAALPSFFFSLGPAFQEEKYSIRLFSFFLSFGFVNFVALM